MEGREKRSATSPLQMDSAKKSCLSDSINDNDDTIITHDEFMSSSMMEEGHSDRGGSEVNSHVKDLKAALGDPHILEMISKAVTAGLQKDIRDLKSTVESLKQVIEAKDSEIMKLQDRVDELEQYGRRNSIRVTSVPETEGECTDDVMVKLCKAAGVDVSPEMIDRSHRVGKKEDGTPGSRPILVKFTSYRHKKLAMGAKKALADVDTRKLFPDASWPALPRSAQASGSRAAATPRVFFNHDLTKLRSEIAFRARNLKRHKKVSDTWVGDGVVFLKKGERVYRVTTMRELRVFEQ